MLPGEVGVAGKNHAVVAVRVLPDRGGDFLAVGDIDDEGANRVGAVIESDGVFGAHSSVGWAESLTECSAGEAQNPPECGVRTAEFEADG